MSDSEEIEEEVVDVVDDDDVVSEEEFEDDFEEFDDSEAEEVEDSPEDDFDFIEIEELESNNRLIKEIIIVDPEKRRTSQFMTEFELTEAINIRAVQISKSGIPLTDVAGEDDPCKMAEKEINDGVCPLILRRKVGEEIKDGRLVEYYEFWDVNKMSKPVLRD